MFRALPPQALKGDTGNAVIAPAKFALNCGRALAPRMMTRHDDVMRTIIDLPAQQLAALDAWRGAHGLSRAEAVRQAVARLLEGERAHALAIEGTSAVWADRNEDGLAYQERLRDEWDR